MNTSTVLNPLGQRIAVVGCGGKTTLVNHLAEANRDHSVLIMTTTKILAPREPGITLCETIEDCLNHKPHKGIQCLGVLDPARGKYSGPPPQYWDKLVQGYDLVLMEADGSRCLPCKGWSDTEPVIPGFTTTTAGIVTLKGLGKPADEKSVLRLPEFCRLTGLAPGDTIPLSALADMIGAPGGMFKNAQGKKILLINRIDSKQTLKTARELAALIRQKHPASTHGIYAGSIIENYWTLV